MKKLVRSFIVYGSGVIFTVGLVAPGLAGGEMCVNKKLVAHLNIAQLEDGEDKAIETIRQMYRHLANGVTQPVAVLLADDVIWKVEGVSETVPFAGTYEGKEGVLRYPLHGRYARFGLH